MSPGDVILIPLPQLGGATSKLRPALLLAHLPGPYQNLLLCGISTQVQQLQADWDELLQPSDVDFPSSGLHHASVARFSYLYAAEPSEIAGVIGVIARSASSASASGYRIIYGLEGVCLSMQPRTGLPPTRWIEQFVYRIGTAGQERAGRFTIAVKRPHLVAVNPWHF